MTTEQLTIRAIETTGQRGKSGKALRDHLLNVLLEDDGEPVNPATARGYLKNLEGAIRELKMELRAIES